MTASPKRRTTASTITKRRSRQTCSCFPYLHSAAELEDVLQQLGYDWTTAQLPDTIDYYLDRTSHGSTLSTVVHSWVLARSKREDAINYLDRTLRADLEVTQAGTTSEGIHPRGDVWRDRPRATLLRRYRSPTRSALVRSDVARRIW